MLRRALYHTALHNIASSKTPSSRRVVAACPHIADMATTIDALHGGLEHAVALPSLRVRGAWWQLQPDVTSAGRAYRITVCRPAGSHHKQRGGYLMQCTRPGMLFQREAVAYAEAQWGSELIDGRTMQGARFVLIDPRQLAATGGQAVAVAGGMLGQTANDTTEALNEAIVELSGDPLVGAELCGERPMQFQYCALCGHWLEPGRCPACDITFPQGNGQRGVPLAMPRKVIDLWESAGHTFARDPRAWSAA